MVDSCLERIHHSARLAVIPMAFKHWQALALFGEIGYKSNE
jgi:hypothetical protein